MRGTRLTAGAPVEGRGLNIAEVCAMQITDVTAWVGALDEPSVAPLLTSLRQTLESFVEIGLGYPPRPGNRNPVGRRGAAHEPDTTSGLITDRRDLRVR